MTVNVLSVSSVIDVVVNLPANAAAGPNLSTLLVLGSSDVIDVVERIRYYATLAAVTADFGSSGPEYSSAVLWFEQSPQPSQLAIGRWAKNATKGKLVGAPVTLANQALAVWTAITNGGFHITVDAGASTNITGLNFSAALTLPGVAAIITAGLTGATCTWNSVYSRFEIESATTGATSAISFLTAPVAGTDISGTMAMTAATSGCYQANGIGAESLVAAVTLFDLDFGQKWYGVMAPEDTTAADVVAVAAYIQASGSPHLFGVTDQEAAVLSPGDTTSLAYSLSHVAGQFRSVCQYSSTSAYAIASYLGRLLTVDYNENNSAITMKFKQEPGVTPENLTNTQSLTIGGKNCNMFTVYNNNTSIVQQGVQADGTFSDVIAFVDWLVTTMQTAVFNLLVQSTTKVPQTDAGVNQIVTTIENVCAQGVTSGGMAPGIWTANGFGTLNKNDFMPKGFYVYAAPIATQSAADRAARKAPPIQVAVKLAGAVHSVLITLNVNS